MAMPSFLRGALLLGVVGAVLLVASRNEIAGQFAKGLLVGAILLLLVNGQTASNIANWLADTETALANHQGQTN